MPDWQDYWQRKRHIPKKLCSQLPCIDSFGIFSEKLAFLSIHTLRIYAHLGCEGFNGTCEGYPFFLGVEKQPCNYGGYRYYFKCSSCLKRMRKVYFKNRIFECRKCLNLGYRSQRLKASSRFRETKSKILAGLILQYGSEVKRPPRMWKTTYWKKLERIRCLERRSFFAYLEGLKYMHKHMNFLRK
jgi:hypothetical protein